MKVVVNRDGREKKLKLVTGMKPVSDELIDKLGIRIKNQEDDERGVLITEVKSGTEAARRGLEPDMVILFVNRIRVDSVKEFTKAIKEAEKKGNRQIALGVQSGMYVYYVALSLDE